MVFPRSSSSSSSSSTQITRRIVPKNDNMSLFGEEVEYTLEDVGNVKGGGGTLSSSPPAAPSALQSEMSVFDTPIPAKRPIRATSYVFEKELREDFDNPYCIDSSSDEEEDESEGSEGMRNMGVSEESLTSHRTVGDSGYEDETGSVSGSAPAYHIKREVYSRPALVQMCFVEEDWAQDLVHDAARMSLNNRHSSSSSGGDDEADDMPLVIPDRLSVDMVQGMSLQQLRSLTSILSHEFTRVNCELLGHLSERDALQEQQDVLLQKIFAVKNAKQTEQQQQTCKPAVQTKFTHRLSSFFSRH